MSIHVLYLLLQQNNCQQCYLKCCKCSRCHDLVTKIRSKDCVPYTSSDVRNQYKRDYRLQCGWFQGNNFRWRYHPLSNGLECSGFLSHLHIGFLILLLLPFRPNDQCIRILSGFVHLDRFASLPFPGQTDSIFFVREEIGEFLRLILLETKGRNEGAITIFVHDDRNRWICELDNIRNEWCCSIGSGG